MPRYKLSKDVQTLNPNLPAEWSIGNKGIEEDKTVLFREAVERHYPSDLPLPISEFAFNLPETRHRFDWCWPSLGIALEVDGGEWVAHGGRHSRDSDRVKQNLAVVAGYRVFHFSPKMLKDDPLGCIGLVASVVRKTIGSNLGK